ncbi:MAG: hypothetical protein LBC18_05345 [Opitutaceae bacterium]|nr:hypothetical protein [Opitutaceae bacterium]
MTAFCLPGIAPAQSTTPAAVDDEIILLDRFVVSTEKDRGYAAHSTLGGTRTNTALKDLANPLDVFTPDLMQDLGVQDIQDLTAFANGVETNLNSDHNYDGQEREVWNYNYMQIRGFKVNMVTRNFMALNSQFEAYNSERVEFSKGPNAILSGIGDPGGSVNYGTKTPKLHKSSYSFAYRTDDLGSQRVTMDVNQVIVKNMLGMRLNAMWENEDFYRHPAYEKQNAWHLTAKLRPTRKTTIDVGHERRRSDRASPPNVFPTDLILNWKNAGSPLATNIPASGNNIWVNSGTADVTASSQGMQIYGETYILDSDGVARNANRTARGTNARIDGTSTTNRDTASTGIGYPNDIVISGPNGINDSDWDITELRVSQIITPELQVELAYGRSDNHVRQGNSVSRELNVDTTATPGNTHGGEWFVQTQPFWIDRQFDITHWRGSASYELDLAKKLSWWAGKHQFAAVAENNENEEWSNTGRFVVASGPGVASNLNYQQSSKYFYIRDYLDPVGGKWSIHDLRNLYYSDGLTKGGYTAKYVARDAYAFYKKRTERDTVLGVLQSRWFGDRVITTIGIRKDWEKLYQGATYVDQSNAIDGERGVQRAGTSVSNDFGRHPKNAPYLTAPTRNSGYSRNYGVVVHATDWLSLSGNYTTNMSLSAESRDMYNNYLPPASGESKDFGVRLSLLDSRLNISLIKYETNQNGYVTSGGSINSPFNDLKKLEDIIVNNDGSYTSKLPGGQHTTTQRQAKGEELTVVGSITRDWTLRLSASRMSNKQTNIAPDVRAYYRANLQRYKDLAAAHPDWQDTSGNLMSYHIANAEANWAKMDTLESTENFPASKYNVRLTTKYSFNRTLLKGLSVGGNIRWASAPIIGYYHINTGESGSLYAGHPELNGMYDITRYAKADAQYFMDLFFSYERKIYRDLLWRVQININNLLDETDPYPTKAVNDKDGADFQWVAYRYRPIDGRVISLTTSVSF